MSRQSMLLTALAAVALVALWWLFLYSPGQDDLAAVEEEIAAAQTEQTSLRTRIAGLEAIRARAPETEAAIAQLRSFVPDETALPGALRQLAAAAEDAGVEILTLSTNRPAVVDEPAGLYAASVTLNLDGSYFQLVDFLRRVEDPQVTARGFDFTGLTIAPGDQYPSLVASLSGSMYAELPPIPSPDQPVPPAPSGDDEASGEADASAEDEEGES